MSPNESVHEFHGHYMSILDRPTTASGDFMAVPGVAEIAAFPQEVLAITGELFPGPLSIEREVDPEVPDQAFLVVTVEATGTVKDIVRRRREWHAKAEPLLIGLDVRLSIIPI
jgi:hypothetical protein